jgi:protein involved in polysaccharide export with SLBB domain
MKSILKRAAATFSIVVLCSLCAAAQSSAETTKKVDSGYVLGPDDQIVIHAIDAPEISDKPFLIGMNGNVHTAADRPGPGGRFHRRAT